MFFQKVTYSFAISFIMDMEIVYGFAIGKPFQSPAQLNIPLANQAAKSLAVFAACIFQVIHICIGLMTID